MQVTPPGYDNNHGSAPYQRRTGHRTPQHEFTERTYEYEGGRRGGGGKPTMASACTGACFGLALLAGATALLWWNEGDAVRAQQSLLEAERALALDTSDLTHMSGDLSGEEALGDAAFGVAAPPAISLSRTVEVFLWREHVETHSKRVPDGRGGELTEKTKTYRYTSGWEPHEVRSASFKHQADHRNPTWQEATSSASSATGLPFYAESWRQRRVSVSQRGGGGLPRSSSSPGKLALGPGLLAKAERLEALAPVPNAVNAALRDKAELVSTDVRSKVGGPCIGRPMLYGWDRTRPMRVPSRPAGPLTPPPSRPPAPPRQAKLDGMWVYSGSGCTPPREPRVGCVRVGWKHAPLAEVSVIGRALRGTLVEWPNSAGAGYELALLEFGHRDASSMLASASSSQSTMTWLKRAGGLLMTWIGWGLLFGPAQYLASWVPLLGGLVGCLLSVVALGAAVAHTFTIIATAWIAHRPVLAFTLLASECRAAALARPSPHRPLALSCLRTPLVCIP